MAQRCAGGNRGGRSRQGNRVKIPQRKYGVFQTVRRGKSGGKIAFVHHEGTNHTKFSRERLPAASPSVSISIYSCPRGEQKRCFVQSSTAIWPALCSPHIHPIALPVATLFRRWTRQYRVTVILTG